MLPTTPPRTVLLGRHFTLIDAALDDGFGLQRKAQAVIAQLGNIVLRVCIVFDGHGTGDAAHVYIALNLTKVLTAVGLAPGGFLYLFI